ncbi:hypothetical protein A8F94_01100 [Bacillus sp. FJAT-27225]|uniref:hypothetical protein n=1 Tax=Bacillus sp. FJAT-27225 TaxID=1743144 RepID=UPI00080C20D2|nr:hypothetical protein [Bacillus sp. FJAT-27225]OCA90513.1 hypothetical protein A8F94_01100 [Bacillus sp. FJAT-27225]
MKRMVGRIDHNVTHDAALTAVFERSIDRRVFILTPSYPFMFIGEIKDVVEDTVEVFVETTHFAQLENRSWFIHIHNIEVFYIEYPGEIEIPKLNDMS